MTILTAEDVYPAVPGRPAAHRGPWLDIRSSGTICTPPPEDKRSGLSVAAAVNDGRWVVLCPCGGAQLAARTDQRLWCAECHVDTGWTIVIWPDEDTVAEAEALLSRRPDPRSRNWRPWAETIDDLRAENDANGVPG